MTRMRAKVRVSAVLPYPDGQGGTQSERLMFHGVAKNGAYPPDGSDEDNTFARWTPSVAFDMQIANPALFGKFSVGDTFYVDFTPVSSEPKT